MEVIVNSPFEHVPAHNCVVWELLYDGGTTSGGTQASATITFDDGGTATVDTVIYFCGQAFATDAGFGENNGYGFNYNGLSGVDRAAAFLETLNANLFFSPSRVSINIFGNVVGVTFNQVGQQSNWSFSDGAISEIALFDINGSAQVYDKYPKYIHTLFRDMSAFSLADIQLFPDKEAAVILRKDYTANAPAAETYLPTPVDYSNEFRNLLATHIPSIYAANWNPIGDFTFSMPIYLRAGYSYLEGCQRRTIGFSKSEIVRVYNCLFQKREYTSDEELMQPYVSGGRLMLIKDRYQICRSTNFAVWTAYINYNNIEIVYYDILGNVLESITNEFPVSNDMNYTNLGTFGSSPSASCDHYIVNFTDYDDEVLGSVRFDIINCGCVDGELIFCTDLGAYETFLLTKNIKNETQISGDVVQGFDGCNIFSLQQGGRSIINKQSEQVYTYEVWVDTETPNELEYVNQLLRSQSVFIKTFIKEADVWFYVKIIPEITNFVSREEGSRSKLTYSFRLNQSYKSHPSNEAVFI